MGMTRRPPGRNGDRRRHARAKRGQVVRLPVGRFGVMLRAEVVGGIEMKKIARAIMAGAVVSLLFEGRAVADERAARLAGEILAYGNACPSVEIDYQALELWATLHGVDISQIRARVGDDYLAISAGNSQAASKLRGLTRSEVCSEALRLFGPGGTVADDMLVPR